MPPDEFEDLLRAATLAERQRWNDRDGGPAAPRDAQGPATRPGGEVMPAAEPFAAPIPLVDVPSDPDGG